MQRISFIAVALVLAVLIWAIYLGKKNVDRPDPEFLATDLFFRLGDAVISVPVVSVQRLTTPPNNTDPLPSLGSGGPFGKPRWFATQEYKTAMRELAAEPTRPAEVSTKKLNFGVYGTYREHLISGKFCPKLPRKWSQKACNNQLRTEFENLPADIYLSTASGLETFAHHHFAGLPNVTVITLIDEIRPIQDTAKVACVDGLKHCYAAIVVTDEFFAVWSHMCTSVPDEICRNRLEAEGTEIQKFVGTYLRAD